MVVPGSPPPSSSSSSSTPSNTWSSSYGCLTGQLFLYAQGRAAFESKPPPPPKATTSTTSPSSTTQKTTPQRKCILLGGLTDGLLPVPYGHLLYEACHQHGFSVVQPILSSSYTGFGHGTLDRDAQELMELLEYFLGQEEQDEHATQGECHFCLVGHSTGKNSIQSNPITTRFDSFMLLLFVSTPVCSQRLSSSSSFSVSSCFGTFHFRLDFRTTKMLVVRGFPKQGCQQIVHLLNHPALPPRLAHTIRGVVLQAPVSDREQAQVDEPETYQVNLEIAQNLQAQGKLEECMPRSAFFVPITGQRFLDLQQRGGRDDYFSSDYTDAELQARLGHVVPIPKDDDDTATTEPTTASPPSQRRRHVLVAFSQADEYVASTIHAETLTQRLVQALNANLDDDGGKSAGGGATGLCLEGANHNLSQPPQARVEFVDAVTKRILQDMVQEQQQEEEQEA